MYLAFKGNTKITHNHLVIAFIYNLSIATINQMKKKNRKLSENLVVWHRKAVRETYSGLGRQPA